MRNVKEKAQDVLAHSFRLVTFTVTLRQNFSVAKAALKGVSFEGI